MAYIGLVEYDEGGTIRSLDGLADAVYDSGRTRNLIGADLSAVKYDHGGRFRTLVGLGQDPSLDFPTDLPLAPPSFDVPLSYEPPSPIAWTPSPIVDTISAPITGTLVDTSGPVPPSGPAQMVNLAPGPSAAASSAPSVLTSIFSGVRNIFSGVSSTVAPRTAGYTLPLPGQPGYVAPASASWFSQPSALGVPNWGLLAGVGVGGLMLMAAMGGGSSSRKRNPARRRRNPAELILMGANPHRSVARPPKPWRRRAS